MILLVEKYQVQEFFHPKKCLTDYLHLYCRVPEGGVFKGGGNWGTLRIPREDWTLGKIREPPPLGTPPLNNPITYFPFRVFTGFLRNPHGNFKEPRAMMIFPNLLCSMASQVLFLLRTCWFLPEQRGIPTKTFRIQPKHLKYFTCFDIVELWDLSWSYAISGIDC